MKNKTIKIVTLLLLTNIFIAKNTFAGSIIYEDKKTEIISQGVIREEYNRLDTDGWLRFNVLRVDLTNPYIKLDTIFSNEGISSRTTILNMAKSSGSIAAINGDFFSPKPGTSLAHSVGPVISDGKIISTPVDIENKNIFGVFSLTDKNIPGYMYWSKNMTLVAPNSKMMQINDINKFGWYTNLYMYDSDWGAKTVGKSETFPTLTQMTVVNNKVTNISSGLGPVNIPKNGFVICGDYEAGEYLKTNFSVGSIVKINTTTTPDYNNMKTAIGGGAILVKNGSIPKYSHDISGIQPRTAIGTTKDNKEAILVTVDGRQKISTGLTQTGLSYLMIQLGAYNALNLDGGGSTTMVSRNLGDNSLNIVNSYSDPSPRTVTNGLGIISLAPKGALSGLKITVSDANIFKNTSRPFGIYGYDEYYNPIQVDIKDVVWTSDGITGEFKGNTFKPNASGKGKIKASYKGINGTIDINVLDTPTQLIISPENFTISQTPKEITIFAKDKYGYTAQVNLEDIKILPKTAINIKGNSISLINNKYNYIRLSFGNVYSYIRKENPVISSSSNIFDGFEKLNGSFWGYPSTVGGKYSLSNTIIRSGNNAGVLEFNFSDEKGTKGAYIKLNQNGYKINTKPSKLSVWAFSATPIVYGLKAEFADAKNNVFRTNLSSSIDWNTWKELNFNLPNDVEYPITLRKIYVVQTDSQVKGSGEVYFDDLSIEFNTQVLSPTINIPKPKIIKDYQEILPKLNNNGASLIGILVDSNSLQNQKFDFSASLVNNKFQIQEYKDSTFVHLTIGKNSSIIKNNIAQWYKLNNVLNETKKQNIFILLDAPLDSFKDSLEVSLIKTILSKSVSDNNKNIWVICPSNKTEVTNIDGVKYISIDNESSKYLNILINKGTLNYYFKSF